MTKEDKLNLQLISAAVLVIVGCGLLIGGFCVATIRNNRQQRTYCLW